MYLCEQKSINKALRNHGGLHNCVTYRLPVLPFTLHECKQYMRAKKIQASHYDLLEYYKSTFLLFSFDTWAERNAEC